ncbi:MAG: autotransporter outer membrane beta-barrel domain-containing protein [Beijerinckiaceae bacterium]
MVTTVRTRFSNAALRSRVLRAGIPVGSLAAIGLLLMVTAAWAAGGQGGQAGSANGGSGGLDDSPGGNGSSAPSSWGGGGGGGSGGGAGGVSGFGSGTFGNGGNGGLDGYVASSGSNISVNAPTTGTNGQNGYDGYGVSGAAGGGGGGAGGRGVVYTTTGATITNNSIIAGGNGGSGGAGNGAGGQGGYGGDGGAGVSGAGIAVINNGTIRGGDGGPGGQAVGASIGGGGYAGAGIEGTSIAITNNGTIAAGTEGSPRNAIIFTGGNNTLTSGQNGVIAGDINLRGTSTVLTISQSSNSYTYSNNITGDGSVFINNSNNNVVTLSGNNTYNGSTNVVAGQLNIANGGVLAGSAVYPYHPLIVSSLGVFNVDTSGRAIFDTLNNAGTITVGNSGNLQVKGNGTNAAGAIMNVNGPISFGSFTNNGLVNANWALFAFGDMTNGVGATMNMGTFVNISAGLFTNNGRVNAAGFLSGSVTNNNTFNVIGVLRGNGVYNFNNSRTGTLEIDANSYTNLDGLNNLGTVNLASGGALAANSFANAGALNFNGGGAVTAAQSFTNSGAINVTGNGTAVATINVNNGSGTLVNSGVINLNTSTATAAGNKLVINGNYLGANGVINAWYSGATDLLYITGTASGTTTLTLRSIAPNAPFVTGATVVTAQGGLNPNAFTADCANVNLRCVLVPSGNNLTVASSLNVATVPTAQGLSGVIASTASRSVSFQSNQAIMDRMINVRDTFQKNRQSSIPAGALAYTGLVAKADDPISANIKETPATLASPKLATWARAYGDLERRTGNSNYAYGGNYYSYDLGYRQSVGGFMGGVDAIVSGLTGPNDALIVGGFGGYTGATVNLNAGGTQWFSGGNVGVYGTYFNGPLFVDLIGKVDLLALNIAGVGFSQSAGLQNYSFLANVGYKFNLADNWYVEPTAGAEYIRTVFNNTTQLTNTIVALENGYVWRGRAGARIGVEWVSGGLRFEPSLTALVYDVFSASKTGSALINAAGGGLTLPSDLGKVGGEFQAAFNVANLANGLSGFVRADLRFSSVSLGGGGKAGIRYQW